MPGSNPEAPMRRTKRPDCAAAVAAAAAAAPVVDDRPKKAEHRDDLDWLLRDADDAFLVSKRLPD